MTLHLDKSKIIHLYTVEKQSAAQIAVEVDASPPCILKRLKKWNIPIRPASKGKIRRDLDDAIDDIVSRYSEDKQTLNEIANIYKVTAPAIRKRLFDAGVQIRPNRGQFNRKVQYIASLDPRDIEKVYNLGKPLFETAAIWVSVYPHSERYSLKTVSASALNLNNGCWVGQDMNPEPKRLGWMYLSLTAHLRNASNICARTRTYG